MIFPVINFHSKRLPEDTLPDDDLSRARRGGDYWGGSHLNFVLEGCGIDEEKGQEGQDQQRRLWLALDGVTLGVTWYLKKIEKKTHNTFLCFVN